MEKSIEKSKKTLIKEPKKSSTEKSKEKSVVYFTKDISSEGLLKIYKALNTKLKGNVAVKISTGELGGHNFLNPNLIAPLVKQLNGTIVECNTAYRGKRFNSKDHWKVIKKHGFLDIAKCDILDEEGDFKIPVKKGKHLKYNLVGTHINNYNSILMLSHFKGHAMGGFGGALKNMSIGLASKNGKANIHSVGRTDDPDAMWGLIDDQDGFLESMAEACSSIIDFIKPKNLAYINVANRLSIDCDCGSHPAEPEMADIGIFASLDPVALDQCCYDAIINSTDKGKKSLVNRMHEKHAIRTVEWAAEIGLGKREYVIESLD